MDTGTSAHVNMIFMNTNISAHVDKNILMQTLMHIDAQTVSVMQILMHIDAHNTQYLPIFLSIYFSPIQLSPLIVISNCNHFCFIDIMMSFIVSSLWGILVL